MIPRILHRIWLDEPIPDRFETFWARFEDLHPEWQFWTWTSSSAEALPFMRCRQTFDAASTWAGKSDVLRYEVLATYGGVYVDTDVEPLRPFDDLLNDPRPFAAWEDRHMICPTVMGSAAGHPAIERLIEALPLWARSRPKAPPNQQTGPYFLTAQWRRRKDVRLLDPVSFYPIHWSEREMLGGPYPMDSYAVHHWAKGWADWAGGSDLGKGSGTRGTVESHSF